MTDPTTQRLDRILYVLPRAIRSGGATLQELAEALGCSRADILADLEEVTARAYYHAAGASDPLQILVDGDRVRVFAGAEFEQPVRLSAREAMALELGLRILAAESPDRADRMLEFARWLDARLAVEPQDPPIVVDVGEDGFRGAMAQAAAERRRCRVLYLRPAAEAPEWRDVAPYMIVHANGVWYVLGHDADRDDLRTFRMDRMLRVDISNDGFDVPADFDVSSFVGDAGMYRPGAAEVEVRVRYSARVARWIAERMPVETVTDGSVIARHRVSDPEWIVRHVLRYGADARVIEPESVRDRVARAALGMTA